MSSRGRGGGHGQLRCVSCGGTFPPTRRNLRAKKREGGFLCASCEGKANKPKKGRPQDYAA